MSNVFVVYDSKDGSSAEVVVRNKMSGTGSPHILHYKLTERKKSRVHLMLEKLSDITFPAISALENASLRRSIFLSASVIAAYVAGIPAIPLCWFLVVSLGILYVFNYFECVNDEKVGE